MKQFLKQAIKYLFLILAVAVLGCDDDDETNFPQVEAGFTYTLNENSGTVTFINISSQARTYLWTFGDGGTSTEINPIKTFANGTYKVSLKATSVSGASATFEDTIIISIPNPITLPVTLIFLSGRCAKEIVVIVNKINKIPALKCIISFFFDFF